MNVLMHLCLLFLDGFLNGIDKRFCFFQPSPDLLFLESHHVGIIALLPVVEQFIKGLAEVDAHDPRFYKMLVKQGSDAAVFR